MSKNFSMANPLSNVQTKRNTQGPSKPQSMVGAFSSDSPTNGGPPYAGSSPNKGFFGKIFKALNPVNHMKKIAGALRGRGGGGGGCPPGGGRGGMRGMMGRMMNPMGGLFSDIRLKENISKTGYSKSGIPTYKFSYKGDDKVWSGVMAQDLLAMGKKNAVHKDKESGYYKVDYSKIDVEMEPLN